MKLLIFQLIHTLSRENDHIHSRQIVLVQAKRLANDTPNTVTFHGLTDIFFGNYKSKPRMAEIVGASKYEDGLVWYLQYCIIKYILEVLAG